jgi:hypothetical protein
MKLLHDGKTVLVVLNDNPGDPLLVSDTVTVFEGDAAGMRDEIARIPLVVPTDCAAFLAGTDDDRRAYELLKQKAVASAELATLHLSEKAAADVASEKARG